MTAGNNRTLPRHAITLSRFAGPDRPTVRVSAGEIRDSAEPQDPLTHPRPHAHHLIEGAETLNGRGDHLESVAGQLVGRTSHPGALRYPDPSDGGGQDGSAGAGGPGTGVQETSGV